MQYPPVYRQYKEVKAQHPDAVVFLRLSDFYETFDDDAETCAKALGLIVSTLKLPWVGDVKIACIPVYAVEGYVARLIEQGRRVVMCDPKGEAAYLTG